MIDLCEDCGAPMEFDDAGVLHCPEERRETIAWRTEWAEQVRRYQAQAGQGLPTINAEDKP